MKSNHTPVDTLRAVIAPGVFPFLLELRAVGEADLTMTATQVQQAIGQRATRDLLARGVLHANPLHNRAVNYSLTPLGSQALTAILGAAETLETP